MASSSRFVQVLFVVRRRASQPKNFPRLHFFFGFLPGNETETETVVRVGVGAG
jgi:hypothetical protein